MDERLGDRIKAVRERRSLTQEEAAAELGIHWRSLQDYEHNKATPRQGPRRRAILAWLDEHEQVPA